MYLILGAYAYVSCTGQMIYTSVITQSQWLTLKNIHNCPLIIAARLNRHPFNLGLYGVMPYVLAQLKVNGAFRVRQIFLLFFQDLGLEAAISSALV